MPRIYLERREMGEELQRLFDLLDGESKAAGGTGECNPPLDVIESPASIDIVMDLPGVPRDSVQVVFARDAVLIAGTKLAGGCGHKDAAFHLAERTFGRFARVVRLSGAVDAGAARATLRAGELRVSFPKVEDRRGRQIRIDVGAA
jgi:HSP20 family protein